MVADGSSVEFEEGLGIQKERTEEAATNMARRGAHFKDDTTPMFPFQHATCQQTHFTVELKRLSLFNSYVVKA